MKKILLIIPAYNEEENILQTIQQINNYTIKNRMKDSLDYIIINDGSKDQTRKVIEKNHLKAIHLVENLGIGGAVQTGYKYAFENNYDLAIQFDGDGQHDINYLQDIIQPILDNQVDFCFGSRFVVDDYSEFQTTFMRRFGINLLSVLIKLVTGKKIYDVTSGFRAANKEIINQFSISYPVEYPEPESLVYMIKKGWSVKEVPVNMKERIGGKSSISGIKSVKYMIQVCLAILFTAVRTKRYKRGD